MTKILLNQWKTSLHIPLKSGGYLWMTINPEKIDLVKDVINERIDDQLNCWFIDLDGVHHAGARPDEIKHMETVERQEKAWAPESPADWLVDFDIYLKDGGHIKTDCTYEGRGVLAKSIAVAMNSNIPLQLGQTLVDGANIVGYNLSASSACHCPTQKLHLQGCPSARGERCSSRSQMV